MCLGTSAEMLLRHMRITMETQTTIQSMKENTTLVSGKWNLDAFYWRLTG